MVKSIWVVEVETYDRILGGTEHTQKEFVSLMEAFAFFKKSKSNDFQYYDSHWSNDGFQRTRSPFHVFVYENEEQAKQQKIREERRNAKAFRAWTKYRERQERIEQRRKEIIGDGYCFNDDDIEF